MISNPVSSRYQDFVIKDGLLVGDFDALYENFPDPWNQSSPESVLKTVRRAAVDQCCRVRRENESSPQLVNRVLELGCGFGHITDELRQKGFAAIRIDCAAEATRQARLRHPASVFMTRRFEDPDLLFEFDPDIIVMSEITWYVLDGLEDFLKRLRTYASGRDSPTYLIHVLETYGPGQQQYGREFFTDQEGILRYFGLRYLETGVIIEPSSDQPDAQGTYFVAVL